MTRAEDIRARLIDNAIHLIAEGGFEKATTKNLTSNSGGGVKVKINEVYIYRLFESKEKLYEAAFLYLEQEFYQAIREGVESIGSFEENPKEKLYEFFLMAWEFVLQNEDRCRCFVRFYYSIYFKGEALNNHILHFDRIMDQFKPIFKEEADVTSIMHSVFTALLDFAIRVYNGDLQDNDTNRPHIFNVLYCMMMTYLKPADQSINQQPYDITPLI